MELSGAKASRAPRDFSTDAETTLRASRHNDADRVESARMKRHKKNCDTTSRDFSSILQLYYAKRWRARLRLTICAFFLLSAFVCRANAAEDWNAFLDALKARGYDDVALVYLKQLQEKGVAPPELDDSELDYKIGSAAFDAWAAARPSERPKLAEETRSAFEKYLASAPEGASAMEANLALARLKVVDGDQALAETKKRNVPQDLKESKLLEARASYSAAKPFLDAGIKLAQARVKAMQGDGNTRVEQLQVAQATFLDARIRQASLQAQNARTFKQGSDEYVNGLTKAAEDFSKIAETYGQYVGSFRARFAQAECLFDLDKIEEAASALDELSALPNEEQFASVKTLSLDLYAKIAAKTKDPVFYMGLVKKYSDWKEKCADENLASTSEGLQIQLETGRALIALEKLRRKDYEAYYKAGMQTFVDKNDATFKTMDVPPKKNKGVNSIVVFALKTIGELAAGSGAVALDAQELLKDELFNGVDLSKYSFAKKIDSFADAVNAANRATSLFSKAREDYATAAADLKDEASREMESAGNDAIKALRNAFEWSARAVRPDKRGRLSADALKETTEEINRLYLKYATVSYAVKRYEDAFVAGEFLAKRRPDFEDAPQAAIIALRSLQSFLIQMRSSQATPSAIEGVQAQLDSFSEYVAKRWGSEDGDSVIAQEAALIKLETAVANGDVVEAKACLEKIPETSPRRADAELRLGQALWTEWGKRYSEYVAARQDPDSASSEDDPAALKAKLDEILNASKDSLYAGLERMLASSSGVTENDYLAIYSTYLLAQIYDRLGDSENAEKWLTHPVIGALTLVERAQKAEKSNDPEELAEIPSFVNDSFQVAVLAIKLGVDAANPDKFEDAEKTMNDLDALAQKSDSNAAKLTGVYLRLGRKLEERMLELRDAADSGDESKQTQLDSVVKGFEAFLKRVSERDSGVKYSSMRWVADSYLALGRGLTKSMSDPPREALVYFSQAGKTYMSIVAKIDSDPSFAPNESAKLSVSVKISESLRLMGRFKEACDELRESLLSAPDNVDVQREAAFIFQDWGRKETKYYLSAIVGASPDSKGRNRIWGWNGLIRRLAGSYDKDQRFRDLFYEAYLAKTRCRYLYTRRLKDKDEIEKQAKNAETDLERLVQTRPDLGGPANFTKFDSAYKNFQKMRGAKNLKSLKNVNASTATK